MVQITLTLNSTSQSILRIEEALTARITVLEKQSSTAHSTLLSAIHRRADATDQDQMPYIKKPKMPPQGEAHRAATLGPRTNELENRTA